MNAKMLIALSALLVAASTRADVASTGGAVVQIAPPPSVAVNVLQSNTQIRVFDEQQGVTLAAPLTVNISAPGFYDDPVDLTPAAIPAGTVINSNLIHFDGDFQGSVIGLAGSVTFADRIIGVILNDADVDASDFLGAPGTVYPPAGLQFRGAELFENDQLEVTCDTITMSLETFEALDHIRVITAHEQPCGQGCSPGFWKQCASNNSRLASRRRAAFVVAGFSPTANINATFGTSIFPNVTLCEALNLNGGGVRRLAREGTAALLSAGHPDVDYPLDVADVIARVKAGDAGTLETFNGLGCPLQ